MAGFPVLDPVARFCADRRPCHSVGLFVANDSIVVVVVAVAVVAVAVVVVCRCRPLSLARLRWRLYAVPGLHPTQLPPSYVAVAVRLRRSPVLLLGGVLPT